MAIDLYSYMKANNMMPCQKHFYQRVGIQLFVSLLYMKKMNVIHCDLKPENIMLKSKSKSQIKVIDFGSACLIHEDTFSYIQSLYYRAPEVILGQFYTPSMDIWSVGCILIELKTGIPLFKGKDDKDQMYAIFEYLGLPSLNMIQNSKRADLFFDPDDNYRVRPSDNGRKVGSRSLKEAILSPDMGSLDAQE